MKYEFIGGVKRNPRNGGVCAHIRLENGENFWADLADVLDFKEFAVFEADENGEVTSWLDVYMSRPEEISEEVFENEVQKWLLSEK